MFKCNIEMSVNIQLLLAQTSEKRLADVLVLADLLPQVGKDTNLQSFSDVQLSLRKQMLTVERM